MPITLVPREPCQLSSLSQVACPLSPVACGLSPVCLSPVGLSIGAMNQDLMMELRALDVLMAELATVAELPDANIEAGSCSASHETLSKSCQRPQIMIDLLTNGPIGSNELSRVASDSQGGQALIVHSVSHQVACVEPSCLTGRLSKQLALSPTLTRPLSPTRSPSRTLPRAHSHGLMPSLPLRHPLSQARARRALVACRAMRYSLRE